MFEKMLASSHLSGDNAAYIDDGLYEDYLKDPASIPSEWREYFDNLPQGKVNKEESHAAIRNYFLQQGRQRSKTVSIIPDAEHFTLEKKQAHVLQLVNAYRLYGHHHANLDPLGLSERTHIPELDLEYHNLKEADLDTVFSTESSLTNNGAKLRDIVKVLQKTYADTLGVEYMHITNMEEVKWLEKRFESVQSHPTLSAEEKQSILKQLTAAEGLEKYLGSKYVGQKRFSLEGGESLIPAMNEIIRRAGKENVKECVIGMAHRGRLNLLVNVLGKSPADLFDEFEGKKTISKMSGDVKYHMGFSSDIQTENGHHLHLALAFNPSHLEIISPVVEGSVRARLRRRDDLKEKTSVVPILIHGDAAFAGQGVVMETFNFSQARGYCTGGTVHIVINNQIGFTTSNPLDARSTLYCTDVAKMVQAPILHVNGNDPEMMVFAAQIAFDFRMHFKRDIVIDLVCYRRHGHNEADEPSSTQPKMYEVIKKLTTTRTLYAEHLIRDGVISKDDAEAMVYNYRDTLDHGEPVVAVSKTPVKDPYIVDWTPFLGRDWREPADTSIPLTQLRKLAEKIEKFPEDFTPHPIVKRLWQERQKMTAGEIPLDWGYGETMAYATLLGVGYPVRLSGQDSGRGTFAHRHAVLHDYKTGEMYIPLTQVAAKSDQVNIIDSVLSEEAVIGFEYGFAAAEPNVLTIWEAQFGDFANGAQVLIDQFISSGEQKWGRLCGLVMYLPHGYEGQGPEHSSARLERYLQLCAQHNMQVCVPTTPAQMFHMVRRQMLRPFRKPLIVMTPKSLLRHKLAVSTLEELSTGSFQLIIPEIDNIPVKETQRVVLCSGKVYYDLLEARRTEERNDVAIIRIEQLYPFPKDELKVELKKYSHVKDIVWCQEEPKNQGAWFASQHNIVACLAEGQALSYVGRGFFAASAVGYLQLHLEQQRQLVEDALRVD